MNIRVSIIIPVYNTPEDCLRKCIESALAQTLGEIEVILVDDGSINHAGVICDEYEKLDSRIQVIHKANGGLSAARNSGYYKAAGEFVTFVDADDWIEPETCEIAWRKACETDADVLIFGSSQEIGDVIHKFQYKYKDGQIFDGDECKAIQCDILDFEGNIATAWAKLIRKSFLQENQIVHNDDLKQGSEGIEFNIRLFERVKRVCFIDGTFYHYVYNPESISAKHDEKNHEYVLRCFVEIEKQIQDSRNKAGLYKNYYNRIAHVVVATAISGYFSPGNRESYRDKKLHFQEYLSHPLVQKTLTCYDARKLSAMRRGILMLIKWRAWLLLSLCGQLRYRQKHRQ